jgi:DNA-directed RNA polymerase subunit RPC12/RpoP
MKCSTCDAELPDDARFCVECGTPVERGSTGPTERLPEPPREHEGGLRCPNCGVANPSFALYCVNCGRALAAAQEQREVGAAPTVAPAREAAALPEAPQPLAPPVPPAVPQPVAATRRRHDPGRWGGPIGGLFLIGLAFLFVTRTFWPGILILVGLTGFLGALAAGEGRKGLLPLLFMGGLAFLFVTKTILPGILVLLGVMAIAGTALARGRGR